MNAFKIGRIGMALCFILTITSVAICCSLGGRVFADGNLGTPIEAKYDYANTAMASLSINGSGKATAVAKIVGKNNVTTKLSVKCQLQRYESGKWKSIQSWSKTVNRNVLVLEKSKNVTNGTYRVYAKFEAYKGTNSETIKKYSGTVRY